MPPPEVFVYVNPSSSSAGGGADCHSQKEDHWIVGTPIANPMSGHGGYKRNRTLWGIDAIGTVICQVGTWDGMRLREWRLPNVPLA